ncbi:MAG: penicillin-binding protein 1C [Candidatus Endobugula sp.]|jgi:penicillin-binding protein 1C
MMHKSENKLSNGSNSTAKKWMVLLLSLLSLMLWVMTALMLYVATPLSTQYLQQNLSTIVVDQQNNLLSARIASDEQWRFSPPKKLPQKYITALIHYEDKRFFQHIGVDPFAIVRAARINFQQGKVVSGGSTLTMQLARLIRVSQHESRERTFYAKSVEALLAFKLEFHLSKSQILIHYAALAPFGGNTVGIEAANWRYFQHGLEKMSWAEAALLAVLPNNPSSIHLGKNRQVLQKKRDRLLEKLFHLGYFSQLDLVLSKKERLPDRPHSLPRRTPHLLATLSKQFPDYSRFTTFIDRSLQSHLTILANSYNQQYEKNNVHNLSILVIDNYHNQVVAYIGNQTRSKKVAYASAVDIIQRPRSSGSLFKPFLFALMLQKGQILSNSLIKDIPSYYDGYQPQNYDRQYRGLIPAKTALSQSLNVPAVRLLQQYGITPFKQDLEQLGLTTLWRPAEDYGLSLILGGAETTLWDITNSFARLMKSAQGQGVSPINAQLHQEHIVEKKNYLISQGAAWLTLDALVDVNRPGVAVNWKDYTSSQKIAWKTGTSYGWHDAWAVGSNGRYTVGVWAGNANGEEAQILTGTKTAAPIMLDAFSFLSAEATLENLWPDKPHQALKTYTVCQNDHYLVANNCASEQAWAPIEADFSTVSPYHVLMHIDSRNGLRVHGKCESPSRMQAISQFTLPPIAAYYYAQYQTDMPATPAWREDCAANLPAVNNLLPLAIAYPAVSAKIKIPVELNGTLGRIVLKARHQKDNAIIFWHLNNRYIDSTQGIHEQAVAVNPGWHQLTLVDNKGYKVSRWFKAL